MVDIERSINSLGKCKKEGMLTLEEYDLIRSTLKKASEREKGEGGKFEYFLMASRVCDDHLHSSTVHGSEICKPSHTGFVFQIMSHLKKFDETAFLDALKEIAKESLKMLTREGEEGEEGEEK